MIERQEKSADFCAEVLIDLILFDTSITRRFGDPIRQLAQSCESETICTLQMKRQQTLGCLKHTDVLCTDEAWTYLFRKHLTSLIQYELVHESY